VTSDRKKAEKAQFLVELYLRLSAANKAGYGLSIHDLRFTIHDSRFTTLQRSSAANKT